MALDENNPKEATRWVRVDRLERQLKDYVEISLKLIWQRQAIFLSATLLAAFYFDPSLALACYSGVVFTEVLDLILARRMSKWHDHSPKTAKRFLFFVVLNTFLSACAISMFVIVIALQQHSGGHFTPLFFLFAAALFAAMNNHQMIGVLAVRLGLYLVAFLFIALMDIWRLAPPLSSPAWLEFFTTVFVAYFIIDFSIVFLRLYKAGLRQLEKLKREHQRTKIAYEAKSQFLSTISHELRTPLTSIKGSLDLVNSQALGPVPEKIQPVLGIAAKNSKRLATLIDDLLDLQKIEAGEMEFNFRTMDLNKLALDAKDASQGYASTLRSAIVTELPDGEVLIMGDESRLMQVMANLISNALKFSDEGGTVVVQVAKLGDRGRISVLDRGVGIPENSKEKVFGQFSQVDASDKRKVGGTGLGMNITRRIVQEHGGDIDYVSEVGLGTTFFVEFDLKPEGDDL